VDSQRPNPFDAALDEVGKAVEGALKSVPLPPHVNEAIDDFDRRISDPNAWGEWQAIINRYGEEGAARYVSEMLRLKRTRG
jgi:ABC-type amino acid transport substrate-binding protein